MFTSESQYRRTLDQRFERSGTGPEGFSREDLIGFRINNALRASATRDWSRAGKERAMIAAAAECGQSDPASLVLPRELPFCPDMAHFRALSPGMQRRLQARAAYQVGTPTTGGNLVQTSLLSSNFIEVLRNTAVTPQLGAHWLTGLVGKVAVPRQISATNTYWVGESGAVSEAEATFDQVTLQPRTIGALSKMSRLMLLQSTPGVEMVVRQDLIEVLGRGIDQAALTGTGAGNTPTGIVNTAGVASVVGGTNGANLSFDHLLAMASAPMVANAPQENLGFAFNAKAYGYLATQKTSVGSYLWMPEGGITVSPGDSVMGHRYAVSNALPYSLTKGTSSGICSELIFGSWQELLIGSWGSLEILLNPFDSVGFTSGDVLIRALQTIDIAVRHPASFAVMADALTPGF